jgi:hypothetical protein
MHIEENVCIEGVVGETVQPSLLDSYEAQVCLAVDPFSAFKMSDRRSTARSLREEVVVGSVSDLISSFGVETLEELTKKSTCSFNFTGHNEHGPFQLHAIEAPTPVLGNMFYCFLVGGVLFLIYLYVGSLNADKDRLRQQDKEDKDRLRQQDKEEKDRQERDKDRQHQVQLLKTIKEHLGGHLTPENVTEVVRVVTTGDSFVKILKDTPQSVGSDTTSIKSGRDKDE